MKQQQLVKEIDVVREQLIYYGMKYGLKADKTVQYSQYLDTLLNQYEELKIKKQVTSS
ncbi:aspartyl-phosphate phosphatase Spo0E family protein [Desertibacillus haloalkaliphilus]|uniref:aspartyl-phosphate phosphatase Spo0E family protein n=1 Tax=Desertibacillus haloalkaliphilus TaxID=1328930 RepID=UPI001C26FF2C|nr:aspartyl-phosphate phosphatase Spo0E family protein [Desertibacillus haloalkaliphilus]MBU8906832.1 aspartyl-phosphate phosphatase Spo0E family protein [Desertibacillus haloalkaliphilus]